MKREIGGLSYNAFFNLKKGWEERRSCADLEGGSGGSGPPLEFAKLNIADITRNEKIVIFHICALPQLYIKQNQSTK